MVHMSVKEHTADLLHFVREPSIRSWSVLIGLTSVGLGAAYYSLDSYIWQLFYIGAAAFIGLQSFEEWEDCILDKKANTVTFKKVTVFQLMNPFRDEQSVVANLDDVVQVKVNKQDVKYAGQGYQVVLAFCAGYTIGITDNFTFGEPSEYEQIAQTIEKFLNLDSQDLDAGTTKSLVEDEESDSSSSDGFEHIDTSDIVNEKE